LPAFPPNLPERLARHLLRHYPEEARRAARAAGPRPTLRAWTERYLSAYLYAPPSRFHHWLADELDALTGRRGSLLNVLAPRGSAKTTWSTLAYPLYCACEGLERYIVLTADTTAQARKYLADIRREVEDNAALRADYPFLADRSGAWREGRIELANGVALEAAGTGSKLRGSKFRQHRPTLIVVDDPQNIEHIISPLLRERSWTWLTKDVLNAGGPGTNFIVLGTALHRECIVYRLQTTPGWRSRLWRSLETLPERLDLWREWESLLHDYDRLQEQREAAARAFYEAHRAEMDRGTEGKVLWPERFPLYDLMLKRASIGAAAFASEQQNDPINPEACEWPAEYFDWPGVWFERWPERLVAKVITLDPSKGTDSKVGDYSAYVLAGLDQKAVLWVDADLARRPTPRMVADGIELYRRFGPQAFAVETNAYQELLAPEFVQAARASKLPLPLYGINNFIAKPVRIRQIGPYLAQRQIRFKARSPGAAQLVQQLKDFPVGDHDDAPDALQMALVMLHWLLGRRYEGNAPYRIVA
jgi:predicted phage terminase large subunit-like protein